MFLKTSSGYPTPKRRSNGRGACPEKTQSIEGTAALDTRPDWRTNPDKRIRRASRAQEHSALHRGRSALDHGTTLAISQREWLTAVDNAIIDQNLRADGQRNRRAIARMVGLNAHWKTLTTSTLTWGRICTITGLSRRCVAKHLLALWMTGWIGRVASGRSAYAKQAAGWTGEQSLVNDAPVYSLTHPVPADDVDTKCTPPTTSGNISSPAHARAPLSTGAASRHTLTKAALGRSPLVPADREQTAFSAYVPTSSKNERIRAAAAWARMVPALRKLTARHLASIARQFFLAGWTVKDLITACDTLPDGRSQGQFVDGLWVAYSGADGIPRARLGHWLKWRLGHWTTEADEILPSPTQTAERKAKARRTEQQARIQADREKRESLRASMHTAEGQSAKQAFLDQVKSRAAGSRRANLHRP